MGVIREQLSLGMKYGSAEAAELRDAAAAENKSLPIHRWVPWIAGFSAQFVQDAIEAYLPEQWRSTALVLDPFAGVGTTLVEGARAGCNVVGYEINAFAALAARAKLHCVDVPVERFQAEVDKFRAAATSQESEIDRLWSQAGDGALASLLGSLSPSKPAGFRSRIPFFSPPVEAKFLYALGQASLLPEADRALFRTALGATMVSFSNYSYEPSLSSRPGAGKPLIENASVALVICRKLDDMLEDIRSAQATYGQTWPYRQREVFHGSYFDSKSEAQSVSLLITSPPYMNNYHYVRNTRPQLHWLGLIDGPSDLRDYEQQSFGKFWQTVRQAKPIALDFRFTALETAIDKLRGLAVERGPYGGPGWANYVTTYFNDSSRLLALIKRQLKPGAYAVIVVGNSIIQGIEFQVDQLLAEMAEQHGLRTEDLRIVRKKRVGNSIIDSSVRNGSENGHKHRTQLYDAALILRA